MPVSDRDAHAPAPRRMITVDEARDRLGESRSQFYRVTLRQLRFYKMGRATRVDESSVDELIEARLAANPLSAQKPRRGRPRKITLQAEPASP